MSLADQAEQPIRIDESPALNAELILQSLPMGVMICTLAHDNLVQVHSINTYISEIFSESENVKLPTFLDRIIGNEDYQGLASQIIEVFMNGQPTSTEWVINSGAMERTLVSQILPMSVHHSNVDYVICTIEDHTVEKMAERNLLHHAFHDGLTGQPNRVLFRNRLEEAVATVDKSETGDGVAVLIINIDRFQQINDSFGHSVGDRFLVAIASTLRRCISNKDTLARLSGDEFAILIHKCTDELDILRVTNQVHQSMLQPFDLDGNEVFTTVSIGAASTLNSLVHPEDLIRDADFAMHRAKGLGKARTEFFQRDTHQRVRSNFHLETQLRRAVEREELELKYQPLIALSDHGLTGFEGLARWVHKDRGHVSPVEFIPLAEETGIIVPLGRWAIFCACRQIKSWIAEFGVDRARPININVSGVQFARDDIANLIRDALEETQIPGNMLRLELTETAIMSNPAEIAKTLEAVKDMGILIALDDFGAGYSSLNYLHQFPIDIIKIDRSFINKMQIGNQTYEILRMISGLAQNLGMKVVAEGLEGTEHIEMIRDLKIGFGQGYYYSPPVGVDAATAMLGGNLPWSAP